MANQPIGFDLSWIEPVPYEPLTEPAPRVSAEELISALDLTTLQGDDTCSRVTKLCQTAVKPLSERAVPSVAAVCIYPAFIPCAREALHRLQPHSVHLAVTSGGFPHGLSPLSTRIHEVSQCLDADEIDIVIRRDLALESRWQELYDELAAMRNACPGKLLKVILATGELKSHEIIFGASMTALMAGADFIKTSTGKETINATIEAGISMGAAVRRFGERSGITAGIKAAGGVRTCDEAREWHGLIYQRLGEEACSPTRFRIGASSLLTDLLAHLT